MIMDQYTGEVKAIVGGRGEKTEAFLSTVRRNLQDSLVPVLRLYQLMPLHLILVQWDFTPRSKTNHTAIKTEKKSITGIFLQRWVTVRKAIEQSMNVVAVKALTEIGEQTGFDYLKSFGFSTVVDQEVINGQTSAISSRQLRSEVSRTVSITSR